MTGVAFFTFDNPILYKGEEIHSMPISGHPFPGMPISSDELTERAFFSSRLEELTLTEQEIQDMKAEALIRHRRCDHTKRISDSFTYLNDVSTLIKIFSVIRDFSGDRDLTAEANHAAQIYEFYEALIFGAMLMDSTHIDFGRKILHEKWVKLNLHDENNPIFSYTQGNVRHSAIPQNTGQLRDSYEKIMLELKVPRIEPFSSILPSEGGNAESLVVKTLNGMHLMTSEQHTAYRQRLRDIKMKIVDSGANPFIGFIANELAIRYLPEGLEMTVSEGQATFFSAVPEDNLVVNVLGTEKSPSKVLLTPFEFMPQLLELVNSRPYVNRFGRLATNFDARLSKDGVYHYNIGIKGL